MTHLILRSICLLVALMPVHVAAQQVTEYIVPTPNSYPYYIAGAPDGSVWFSELEANKVGRLSRDARITEYQLPIPLSRPLGIAVAADGTVWFAESGSPRLGRISPSGELTEFPTSANPYRVCLSPTGAVYFTEYQLSRIGRLDAEGVLVEFPVGAPVRPSGPWACAADSEGNIWYAALISGAIGKLSPSGAVTEFRLPGGTIRPEAITVGADGNVWFVDTFARRVTRMTPDGVFVAFATTRAPQDITVGSDGYLWFTQIELPAPEGGGPVESGSVVRLDYNGNMTEYAVAGNPVGITYSDGIWATLVPNKVVHLRFLHRRRAVKR